MSALDDMSAGSLKLASRIQDGMRTGACWGRDHEQIGPFLATFNHDDDNPFLNYAVPDIGATPSLTDVEDLCAAYRQRDRKPRLEYIPSLAPAVEPVLMSADFTVEDRSPVMTCATKADVCVVTAEAVELLAPASDDEYQAAAAVQWEAYEGHGEVPQRAGAGLRKTVEAGGVVVLARDLDTGQPAGAGLCTSPQDGLTELSSVGVGAAFRRRGIAAAMASWLAQHAFASGATGVFLTAGQSERIYARAGFVSHFEMLYISRV